MTELLQEIVKPAPFAHLKKSAALRPVAAKKVAEDDEKDKDKDPPKDDKDAKKSEDEGDNSSKAEDKDDDGDDDKKDSRKSKGKKKVKAEDDDGDDDKKDARSAERARIESILTSCAENPEQAAYLAFKTDMSAETALGILKFSKSSVAKTKDLSARMETVPESTFVEGEPSTDLELSKNPTVRLMQEANERRHGKTVSK